MNILVTGGKGQLGQSFEKITKEYPHCNFIFTDMPEVDITDKECVSALVKENSIDLIINCAAYTAVDKAESEPELAEKINVEGARILAEVTFENDIRLVHISTDYVFNGQNCHPLKEDKPTDPIGVYGKTKLEGEKAIQSIGCHAAIVRTAWLYSEFGNNFVKTMLRLGKEKDNLKVVYDQVGTPTYAPDLARVVLKIAENGIEGFEIYHYSNEGVISWYDFTKEIFDLANIHIPVGAIESYLYPTPAQRPAYSVLAKDKVKAAGVNVPYWKDSLRICLAELNELKEFVNDDI